MSKSTVIQNLMEITDPIEVLKYLEKISADTHPNDHEFTAGKTPGQCSKCGWIQDDVICDDCREPMRDHLKVLFADLSTDLLMSTLISVLTGQGDHPKVTVLDISVSRKKRE